MSEDAEVDAPRRRLRHRRLPRGRRLAGPGRSPTTRPPTSTRLVHALRQLPGGRRHARHGLRRRGLLRAGAGARRRRPGCCSPTSTRRPSGRWRCSVVDHLDLPLPDDDDDQVQPAGDLGIVADLGHGRHGPRRAVRRPRPLPRRAARRHRRPARLRARSSTTWSTRLRRRDAGTHAWRTTRDAAALDEARARWRPATSRSAPSSLDADRRRHRPRPQPCARPTATRPRTPRSSRCAQAAADRGAVAARRLHAGRHPRAVHDVRRGDRARPRRPAGLRRLRRRRRARSARCGTWSATGG